MTASFLQSLFPLLQPIVQGASQELLRLFYCPPTITTKSDGSLVTQADLWADQYFRETLGQKFPTIGILSEEIIAPFPDREWCWVIDPLDGTTNFARGIPIWAISIGLLYYGKPVWGYVVVPPLAQAFYGYSWEGNQGAWFNDRPLQIPTQPLTPNHFVSFCSRSLEAVGQSHFPFKLRMLGVATYNLLTVGTGATLGALEATPKVWDLAAVWVILSAAGACLYPLNPVSLFPLVPHNGYHTVSYPLLVTSDATVQEILLPLAAALIPSAQHHGSL